MPCDSTGKALFWATWVCDIVAENTSSPVPAISSVSFSTGHLNKVFLAYCLRTNAQMVLYTSGIQPGVRVPPGVREDISGGT